MHFSLYTILALSLSLSICEYIYIHVRVRDILCIHPVGLLAAAHFQLIWSFNFNRSEHMSSLVPLLPELKGEVSWLDMRARHVRFGPRFAKKYGICQP